MFGKDEFDYHKNDKGKKVYHFWNAQIKGQKGPALLLLGYQNGMILKWNHYQTVIIISNMGPRFILNYSSQFNLKYFSTCFI
jgi:hypothetical protein